MKQITIYIWKNGNDKIKIINHFLKLESLPYVKFDIYVKCMISHAIRTLLLHFSPSISNSVENW